MKLILATDLTNGIGKNNGIPWKCKDDLKHFQELTINQTVLMGRKTYESIGHPLSNRVNVVVTSQNIPGVTCITPQDIKLYKDAWVIGGAELIKLCEPYITQIYWTIVSGDFDCDVKYNLAKLLKDKKISLYKTITKNEHNTHNAIIWYAD